MMATNRPRTGWAYLDDCRQPPYGPLAMAHRGGAKMPANQGVENTARAFRNAVDLGYRYLETDVHASSDGVLFAFHDDELARLTGEPGSIGSLTATGVGTLAVGGEPIPRLVDLLEEFPEARFNIDIKTPEAIEPLAQLLHRTGANLRCCVASFDTGKIRAFRELSAGAVATAASRAESIRFLRHGPRGAAAFRRSAGFSVLQLPRKLRALILLRPWVVGRIHAAGAHVHAWTVDDAAQISQMIQIGVDGIFTDRPDVLKDVLCARGIWRER